MSNKPKIYSPIATGSTEPRDLRDRFADVLNVKDFGAKGDGKTDDTDAIQAALDAAETSGTGRVLAEGIFKIASTIRLPSNVHFGGNSRDKCDIRLNGEAQIVIKPVTVSPYYARGVSLCAFITATAGWKGTAALEIAGCEYSYFDVEVKAPAGTEAVGVLITTVKIEGAYRKGRNNRFDNIRVSNFSTGVKITKASGDKSTDGSTFNTFIHGHISGYKKGVHVEYGEASSFIGVRCTTTIPGSSTEGVDAKTIGWHIEDAVALLVGCGADFSSTLPVPGTVNAWGFPHGRDANTADPDKKGTNSTIGYRFSPGAAASILVSPRGDGCADRVWFDDDTLARTVQVIGYSNPNWISNVSTNLLTSDLMQFRGGPSRNSVKNVIGNTVNETVDGITYRGVNLYFSASALSPSFSDGSLADNYFNLGQSNRRWENIYAGTAEIDTSDAREKVNLTDPDEALMKAWSKVNFKSFQFTDAVEKKGEESARIHFGVVAQQIQEAFASEGLDASKYALFCYDAWDDEYEDIEVVDVEATYDENGNELTPQVSHTEKKLITPAGDRYGIRYSEALALEATYQRWLGKQRDKEITELKAMLANSKSAGYTLS